MALEATSVQAGDPAPDFALPRLGGPNAGELVTLSSHFGKRPVALIFGSYT
jgi:peroxiredoxin